MTPDAEIKAFPAQVTDRHFIIDPARHTVAAQTMNLNLARFSDGADRFVFTIPGVAVDGHSLADCNSVMVHFENIGEDPEQRSVGIYPVEDLVVGAESATCSWLIRKEATAHTGALIFSVHFVRIADDGTEEYRLPTLTYYRVTVGPTVWNSETIAEEHPDIIAQFDARIKAVESGKKFVKTVNSIEPDKDGNVDVYDAFAIHFDGPQDLTPEEQAQAKANLGITEESLFAYNFTAISNELVESKKDADALRYIVQNWNKVPMSIYIMGYPVIGIDMNGRYLKVLQDDRNLYSFKWQVYGASYALAAHSVVRLLSADDVNVFTPTAKVTQTNSGAVITITDKDGTTSVNVANGKDGPAGPEGPQGPTGEVGS